MAVEVHRAPELAAAGYRDTLFDVFRAQLRAALVAKREVTLAEPPPERDPGEERNLVGRHPGMARRFDADLDAILARVPRPPRETGPGRPVDAETREALRNLGYLP